MMWLHAAQPLQEGLLQIEAQNDSTALISLALTRDIEGFHHSAHFQGNLISYYGVKWSIGQQSPLSQVKVVECLTCLSVNLAGLQLLISKPSYLPHFNGVHPIMIGILVALSFLSQYFPVPKMDSSLQPNLDLHLL